ncbi:heavy metal translocating P-type ATPase [Maridesulfovibrio hydrothermalis]|uniref:P-type Zn(2+) transporter n=1 Tax=Maridesulfovibrio hydrothermalis AM13 = DSM 14728 TaxID=1121451 RepID=L0RBJ3_9BACT|nr:cation-translocating P-type ATPase [Maridesulfovibrio hydrothermalis]CCO22906.1 Heavy metal translocating P-type ATPase [Maridesulfovibrio hydrothermalis AM13 = DSM 14728]
MKKQHKKASIKHSIPGRIRIKIPDLKKNLLLCSTLERGLERVEGIRHTRSNEKCACLIIRYNSKYISPEIVTETVLELVGIHTTETCPIKGKSECGCPQVKSALRYFSFVSAVGGAVLISESLLGLTIAQTLFSPLGFLTVLAAAPLVKEAVQKAREKKFGLEGILAGGIMAAVIAGEAMTAFEILWINAGAELLTAWITERSRQAISGILDNTTHHTFVLKDGVEVEVELNNVQKGDVVVLHTGEKICVDGTIVDGQGLINEAPITGRADFIHKKIDDQVFAGTFVREGVIYVKAEEVGDRTYLARILYKVEDSLENKTAIESTADKLSVRLVKIGLAATIGTLLLTRDPWRAFTVLLVMACPCATILSASTPISAAINTAARHNILIKGGRYLEEVGSCNVACFDKTGTLTGNEPSLEQLHTIKGIEEKEILTYAFSVETHNHHPLAQAIKTEADKRDIVPLPHTVCEYFLGKGMRAELPGHNGDSIEILVGNKKLTEQFGVRIGSLSRQVSALKRKGLTVLYVIKDKEPIGLMAFANTVREGSYEVLASLEQNGVERTVMVTGDEPASAANLAESLGISEIHASAMPEEKAQLVRTLQKDGGKVMMVGDGINDALALAQADVGIAMGTGGAEVAVEAADIALINDDLNGLTYVQRLSQDTVKIAYQNFWLATGSNIVGVVMGATGVLSPVMAGFLHIIHTIGVIANSSRLLSHSPKAIELNTGKTNELS